MTSDDQPRTEYDDLDARAEAADGGIAIREEGFAARPGTSFDPTPHIQQLRGRGGSQDYLGVRWSLVWLRKEHPDAQIVTEHVQIDPTIAIFKATVTLPTGGMATGYGSETASDFGDYIEKAETKAIGRALRALGFGAPNSDGSDEAEAVPAPSSQRRAAATGSSPRRQPTPIDRPAAERTAPPARQVTGERTAAGERNAPVPEPPATRPAPDSAPTGRARPAAAATTVPDSAPASRTRSAATTAPVPSRTAPPTVEPVAPTRPAPESAMPATTIPSAPPPGVSRPARPADDTDLADYSWSAFWPWARSIGLLDKKAIEDLIGRTTDGLLPAELRGLILAARDEG